MIYSFLHHFPFSNLWQIQLLWQLLFSSSLLKFTKLYFSSIIQQSFYLSNYRYCSWARLLFAWGPPITSPICKVYPAALCSSLPISKLGSFCRPLGAWHRLLRHWSCRQRAYWFVWDVCRSYWDHHLQNHKFIRYIKLKYLQTSAMASISVPSIFKLINSAN